MSTCYVPHPDLSGFSCQLDDSHSGPHQIYEDDVDRLCDHKLLLEWPQSLGDNLV